MKQPDIKRWNRVPIQLSKHLTDRQYKILDWILYKTNLNQWNIRIRNAAEDMGLGKHAVNNVFISFRKVGWLKQDKQRCYIFDYNKWFSDYEIIMSGGPCPVATGQKGLKSCPPATGQACLPATGQACLPATGQACLPATGQYKYRSTKQVEVQVPSCEAVASNEEKSAEVSIINHPQEDFLALPGQDTFDEVFSVPSATPETVEV